MYVARSTDTGGRLVVALGRKAGDSVTRSRARRVARDVFRALLKQEPQPDILLVARDDIRQQPRREIRQTLQRLITRGNEVVHPNAPARGDPNG
jgi:ribonuclease P protein component